MDGLGSREQFLPLVRAGAVGAAAVAALGTPLDVAKHAAQAAFAKRRPPLGFPETLRAASSSTLGLTGLCRGIAPAVCHAAFGPAVFLLVYEQQRGDKGALEAAAYARAAQTIVLQPFDFFRTCRQAGAGAGAAAHLDRGFFQVIASDGSRSMWRGLIPTLLRDVPACLFFCGSYAQLRGMLYPPPPDGFDPEEAGGRAAASAPASTAFLGAACAAGAAILTQPLDVIKTRMQVHQLVRSDKAGWRKITTARVLATFWEVQGFAGARGFFVGATARCLRASLGGLLLGPLCDYCGLVADDALRPVRHRLVLGEDPSRTIVHPRSYKSMYIEVK